MSFYNHQYYSGYEFSGAKKDGAKSVYEAFMSHIVIEQLLIRDYFNSRPSIRYLFKFFNHYHMSARSRPVAGGNRGTAEELFFS